MPAEPKVDEADDEEKSSRLDLEALLRSTPDSRAWLRQRIRDLRQYAELKVRLSSMQLAADTGVSAQHLDEFVSGKRNGLSSSGHESVVRHLWSNKWCGDTWLQEGIAAHPAALFHALGCFLGVGEQTNINLRHEVAGTYRLWRASMHVPGKHLLGRLDITNEIETGAVRCLETQVYKGDEWTAAQREVFEGFIVKKSRCFLMTARHAGMSHKGMPRSTIFHNAIYENGLIRAMQGIVTGCYGSNSMFMTPVYVERADDLAGLDKQLNVLDEIPASVKAKLHFHLQDDVIRF